MAERGTIISINLDIILHIKYHEIIKKIIS